MKDITKNNSDTFHKQMARPQYEISKALVNESNSKKEEEPAQNSVRFP